MRLVAAQAATEGAFSSVFCLKGAAFRGYLARFSGVFSPEFLLKPRFRSLFWSQTEAVGRKLGRRAFFGVVVGALSAPLAGLLRALSGALPTGVKPPAELSFKRVFAAKSMSETKNQNQDQDSGFGGDFATEICQEPRMLGAQQVSKRLSGPPLVEGVLRKSFCVKPKESESKFWFGLGRNFATKTGQRKP